MKCNICFDGDPGCPACHPLFNEEQRRTARVLKQVELQLLVVASKEGGSIPLNAAAHSYRVALEAYRRAFTL
jgi:hypothetical protein